LTAIDCCAIDLVEVYLHRGDRDAVVCVWHERGDIVSIAPGDADEPIA